LYAKIGTPENVGKLERAFAVVSVDAAKSNAELNELKTIHMQ